MTQKASRFIVLAFLATLLFMPLFQAQAQSQGTIFGGIKDAETGENVGICLNNPEIPECEGVTCNSIEFDQDIRCLSEAEAGTLLVKGELSGTGITQTDDFGDLILKAINFALPYLSLAAFLGFVVAGFLYVTAFGEEERLTKAKNIMLWSIAGLLLVIFSFAIVQFFTVGFLDRL